MADKIITHIEALEKAKSYCAYQERCHKEISDKLYSWKLNADEINYIIDHLLQENYLNEERFAIAFAGGKFRIKHWGRKKIVKKLKEKRVSEYCIKKALEEIDDKEYIITLHRLIEKKHGSLKEKNPFTKKKKTAAYVYGKGYESDLIWGHLNDCY
jgi:regulatory protein